MKKTKIAITTMLATCVAAIAFVLTPAHATTVKDTFTCRGTLTSKGHPGYYDIVAVSNDEDEYPMTCMLDDANKASSKQILAVCHEGDTCIVRAAGESGNGNRHAIDKVLSVRRVVASECVVNDPTGTPLNVRTSPNGSIVGALHNGTQVEIMSDRMDGRHRIWFFVVPQGSGKSGFVYSTMIHCKWE